MEQMEEALKELFERNGELMSQCERLELDNNALRVENVQLHDRLIAPCPSCGDCVQIRSAECVQKNGTAESDVSLLKSLNNHSTAYLHQPQLKRALQIIAMGYLLYQTCWMSLMTMSLILDPSRKSPRACCKTLLPTWIALPRSLIMK